MTLHQHPDHTLYNNFVAHNGGSFLQSWEWGEWQQENGREAHRYILKNNDDDNNNDTALAAQFIEHTTPFGKYLYCPYGPVVRTGIENTELGTLIDQLLTQIKSDNHKLLFLRLEPKFSIPNSKFHLKPVAHTQPDQTLIVDINKSVDELFTSFHPKTRYNIKVAEKHGVKVKTFTDVNQSVIDLIIETSNRQKYRNHSRAYVEKLWDFFAKNNGDVKVIGYLASIDSKPAASGLMIDFAKTRMYLFGGSNYELRNYMAPYLLHWQAMIDAKQKDLTTYDLGASKTASGTSSGFMRFKLGFSPTLVKFGGTFDVINKYLQYYLYFFSRGINRFWKHL